MIEEGKSQFLRESYKGGFLKDVHRLLYLGYEDARSQIKSDSEEDDITGFIAHASDARTDEPAYVGRYEIHEQRPVHNARRSGKRRQKIDIIFKSIDKLPKREFCCEAKRLKTSICTISDYVGDEGMQCFLRCEYAEDYSTAAMIGYMQNSNAKHWHGELKRVFKSPNKLNIQESLQERKVLDELPNEWFSSHARVKDGEKRSDVGIYHIFLECHTLHKVITGPRS